MVDSSYYCNVSAIDLLADWLEETEEEKKRFTEDQAEEKITYLLYRELKSGCKFFEGGGEHEQINILCK